MSKRAASEPAEERPPKLSKEEYEERNVLQHSLDRLGLDTSSTFRDLISTIPLSVRPGAVMGVSPTDSQTNNHELAKLFTSLPGQPLAPFAPRRLHVLSNHERLVTESAYAFLGARLLPGTLDTPLWDLAEQEGRASKCLDSLISYLNMHAPKRKSRTTATKGKKAQTGERSLREIPAEWWLMGHFNDLFYAIGECLSALQTPAFAPFTLDTTKHQDRGPWFEVDFYNFQGVELQLLVKLMEAGSNGLEDDMPGGFGWDELSCSVTDGMYSGEQVMILKNLAIAFTESPFTCFSHIFVDPSSFFIATIIPLDSRTSSSDADAHTTAASSAPELQLFPYLLVFSPKHSNSDPRFALWSFYLAADSRHFASRLADLLVEKAEYNQLLAELANQGYTIRPSSSILQDKAFGGSRSGEFADEGAEGTEQDAGAESELGSSEGDEKGVVDRGEDAPQSRGGGSAAGEGSGSAREDEEHLLLDLLTTPTLRTHLAGTPVDPTFESTLIRIQYATSPGTEQGTPPASAKSTTGPSLCSNPPIPYYNAHSPKTSRSSSPCTSPLVERHLVGTLSPSFERPVYRADYLGLRLVLKHGSKDEILPEARFLGCAGSDIAPRLLGVFKYAENERYCFVQPYVGRSLRDWDDLREEENKTVALHAKGIYHDDLAPRNVVRGKDGIKIIDFGMAFEHECKGARCDELRGLRHLLGFEE
ncbi:hypothetical protein BJY59DRAFT_719263 [Rhodotorula toruloides]